MFNHDLQTQIEYLEKTLAKSDVVSRVLELAPQLEMPNWYFGAGALCQTVWNDMHGFPLDHGIKDCDLVYFDPDTSYEAEDIYVQKAKILFKDLPIEVDLKNEARVHLWYPDKHGVEIKPYTSTEAAINTWPTTVAAVGVRYEGEKFVVYAPRGLNDMLGMIARANKGQITQDIYEKKVERWRQVWPKLTVIPWDA